MNLLSVASLLIVLHMGTNSVSHSLTAEQIVDAENYVYNKMPDSCPTEKYCFDKGDKYPDELIAKLVEKMPEVSVVNPQPTNNFDLQGRQGNNPKDNPNCPANTTFHNKPIYYIADNNDTVRVVIQSPKFQQLYSVEWCLNAGRISNSETFVNTDVLKDYNVECVNTYMDSDFLVLQVASKDDPQIEIVSVSIPVCCRCRYSKA